MKAFTDIEQSKKLAEILPIESADMHYATWTILDNEFIVSPNQGNTIKSLQEDYGNQIIPCWSLAALLGVIKPINENTYTIIGTLDRGAIISFDEITSVMYQEKEIIDAVFKMVVWLKKNYKI